MALFLLEPAKFYSSLWDDLLFLFTVIVVYLFCVCLHYFFFLENNISSYFLKSSL